MNEAVRKLIERFGESEPLLALIDAVGRIAKEYGNAELSLNVNRFNKAIDFYKRFISNDQEYLSDEKWFKAAQEADRDRGEGNQRLTPVNVGETPSDDVDSYLANVTSGDTSSAPPVQTASSRVVPPVVNSTRASLLPLSEKIESASGLYTYKSQIVGMTVTVRCMKNGHNIRHQN